MRNPIDCAISNRKEGHVEHFHGMAEDSLPATVDYIIREIAWFLNLQQYHPGRFFHYLQNDFDEKKVRDLGTFLDIPADERWIADCMKCYRIKGSYGADPEVIEAAKASAEKHLVPFPQAKEKIEAMLEENAAASGS